MGGQEEEVEEEGMRYPRKELIFSSLPYAHALTLQVDIYLNFIIDFHFLHHTIYNCQARGKVCEGCLSPANPFTECSNCLANHCSTECRLHRKVRSCWQNRTSGDVGMLRHIYETRVSAIWSAGQPIHSLWQRMLKLSCQPLLNWMQVAEKYAHLETLVRSNMSEISETRVAGHWPVVSPVQPFTECSNCLVNHCWVLHWMQVAEWRHNLTNQQKW